jgi:hypothetical protein
MIKAFVIFFVFLASFACFPQKATAQTGECWTTFDWPPRSCPGPNGCIDSYVTSSCMQGCVRGQCFDNGGYGDCCGTVYSTAVIYPEGHQDCSGEICGDAPVRVSHLHPVLTPESIELAHRLDLTSPSGNIYPIVYRPARLLLVPNRCSHGYGAMLQEALQRQPGE